MKKIWTVPVMALFIVLSGCTDAFNGGTSETGESAVDDSRPAEEALSTNLLRIMAYADSIEAALRPVPLLSSAQVNAFRRYRNADQLVAARRLGLEQPVTEAAISRHLESGRLRRLTDNQYWFVRESEYSRPVVTPDLYALLIEIAERFQGRLIEMGLPPLRLEITSALRSAEDQDALREVNPNAAIGESTHQYGTSVDVTYASFRAPREPVVELDLEKEGWMEPHLRSVEALAAETGAARMSRELQKILGEVLLDLQSEGAAMVTLEIYQPVYHLTVARRMDE
ncbi:MAG: DUF5715 family protein [Bacteroidota bacterium]